MPGLKVSLICLVFMASVKSNQALQNAMTLYATCDEEMKVYFDGELQPETVAMKNWKQTSQLSIPAGTRVLAIACNNLGHKNFGILASTSTDLKTTVWGAWRCSGSGFKDWVQPSFDFPPNSFPSPSSLGYNGVAPWGVRPDIRHDAQWIWPAGSRTWAGCRINIDSQLLPINAHLSSNGNQVRGAAKCIDGITTTDPSSLSTDDMCHNDCKESTPWLALEFAGPVEVTRVNIYNRGDECGRCALRTKNVEVRLVDELPTSGYQMHTGGQLLGNFSGPGKKGEIINVEGPVRTGRYVLVQMNNRDCLNLHEVEAFGRFVLDTNTTTEQMTGDSVKWVPAPITLLAILLLLF